jgi:hypothetical protein
VGEEPGQGLWGERLAALVRRREEAYVQYFRVLDRARLRLDGELDRLGSWYDEVLTMRDDAVVLVRNTPGPAVRIYHFADHPCGRVTSQASSRASFDECLEGEAKARGLGRCTGCHWYMLKTAV